MLTMKRHRLHQTPESLKDLSIWQLEQGVKVRLHYGTCMSYLCEILVESTNPTTFAHTCMLIQV
jgi:hypothetical protein